MNPNTAITVRVWCSPFADSQLRWKWAVQNIELRETFEFGAEENEADAKREATEARAAWIRILTDMPAGR